MPVREATSGDVEAIARVHVDTWRHSYRGHMPDAALEELDVAPRQAMWQRILTTDGHPAHVFVAEEGGQVMGFSAAGPAREAEGGATDHDDGQVGELYALYVAPRAQRQGHGAGLLRAAEHDLLTRGYDTAVVWVLATNAPTIAFYEAHGWSDDGVEQSESVHGVEVCDRRYRKPLG